MKSFYLYKGLKKPLVLYGLKDKYIYYALGWAVFGLILLGVLNNLIGIIGTLIAGLATAGGIWGIFYWQDTRGLYNKTKNSNDIYIVPKRFKLKNLKKQ